MKIGVTGASGFVGRETELLWAAQGNAQLHLFGRSGGSSPLGARIYSLPTIAQELQGLDVLVHIAGLTNPKVSEEELRRANLDLARRMAQLCAEAGVSRFVLVSSVAVHGRASRAQVGPNTPFAPVNGYGRSKAAAEVEVQKVCAAAGMGLAIVRPPMVYGPGASGSFEALRSLVMTGMPLPFGNAIALRSFCSVHNVASAIHHAARVDVTGVLVPADPEDVSVRELIQLMAAAAGRKSPYLARISPSVMKTGLRLLGKGEMASSLFDPLVIDRSHWAGWGWAPPQSLEDAVSAASSP